MKNNNMFSEKDVIVASKRKNAASIPPGYTEVSVDRTNRILGNQYILNDPQNFNERDRVIAMYKKDFESDFSQKGSMFKALNALADRVKNGEKIALMCWCSPKKCHADILKSKILDIIGVENTQKSSKKQGQMDLF